MGMLITWHPRCYLYFSDVVLMCKALCDNRGFCLFVCLRYILGCLIRVPLSIKNNFMDKGIQTHLPGTGIRFHTKKLPTASHPQHQGRYHSFPQKSAKGSPFIPSIYSVPMKIQICNRTRLCSRLLPNPSVLNF